MSLSTKVLFFCFSSLLLLPCQKTLVFRFFSINSQVILKNSRPLASNFSILLSNLLKKISIQEFYDTETTTARRKQKNKTLVDRKQLFPINKAMELLLPDVDPRSYRRQALILRKTMDPKQKESCLKKKIWTSNYFKNKMCRLICLFLLIV